MLKDRQEEQPKPVNLFYSCAEMYRLNTEGADNLLHDQCMATPFDYFSIKEGPCMTSQPVCVQT